MKNIVPKIECDFCNWIGYKGDLTVKQHCPNCQSPTTKNKIMNNEKNTKPKVKITLDEVNKLNEIYNEVKPK